MRTPQCGVHATESRRGKRLTGCGKTPPSCHSERSEESRSEYFSTQCEIPRRPDQIGTPRNDRPSEFSRSLLSYDAGNPAATHDLVAVIENCRLPGSDGTLRMLEGDEGFARPMRFD